MWPTSHTHDPDHQHHSPGPRLRIRILRIIVRNDGARGVLATKVVPSGRCPPRCASTLEHVIIKVAPCLPWKWSGCSERKEWCRLARHPLHRPPSIIEGGGTYPTTHGFMRGGPTPWGRDIHATGHGFTRGGPTPRPLSIQLICMAISPIFVT